MSSRPLEWECDVPVHGVAVTAASLAGATFNDWAPGDSGNPLAAAPPGKSYFVRMLHVITDVPATLTLFSGVTPVYGPVKLVAGFIVIPFPGRGKQLVDGGQPKVSLSATAGGNVDGNVELFGSLGPS